MHFCLQYKLKKASQNDIQLGSKHLLFWSLFSRKSCVHLLQEKKCHIVCRGEVATGGEKLLKLLEL